jgi:transcriptional regulator with XRE-family HTH domain
MEWNVAERLEACRREKGWSITEFARRAKMNPTLLWKILHGDRPNIAAVTVKRLARVLGVTTDYLLGMDVEESEALPTLPGMAVQTV